MNLRTFLFILFIVSSLVFFLASYQPEWLLELCDSKCYLPLNLEYIWMNSLIMSTLSLVLFVIVNHFVQKRLLEEQERIAKDRLNIESIHQELEALKK